MGNKKWNVKFDIDRLIKPCGARSLQVVREDEGLPINKVPSTTNASIENIVSFESLVTRSESESTHAKKSCLLLK